MIYFSLSGLIFDVYLDQRLYTFKNELPFKNFNSFFLSVKVVNIFMSYIFSGCDCNRMAYFSLWLEDSIAVFYCHDCGKIFAKTQLLFYLQDLCMTKRKRSCPFMHIVRVTKAKSSIFLSTQELFVKFEQSFWL